MEYWKLAGSADGCEIRPVDIREIAASRDRLEALIRRFDDPAEAYAVPEDPVLAAKFNDYRHLTRRDEWEAV